MAKTYKNLMNNTLPALIKIIRDSFLPKNEPKDLPFFNKEVDYSDN